jgi:homoserine dehydrogenase
MIRALEKGKHVVTANKALLASGGNALFRLAADRGLHLAFEAAVGGCMPIIKTIRESLVGNRIGDMTGILNGTCNYILSRITDAGIPYPEALAEAQRKGYAEADPYLDVEGLDTAHKLALLTALAYGMEIDLDAVYIEGISQITPVDIQFADQFGYRIKLLAIGKDRGDAVEARVHPTMIPVDNLLASVSGSVNAVTISGDAVGDILLKGRGAGMMPTASAVISDTVDIARDLTAGAGMRLPPLGWQPESIHRRPVLPIDELRTHYYFRFTAKDEPGVLSKISGILGQLNISLQSVHQKGRKSGGSVPVVMMTHRAREADVRQAMREIQALEVVTDMPVVIRVEDENHRY